MRAARSITLGARRAFTLVELLVVIGIIAVLAGLVLAVGAGVAARSERQQIENVFSILDQAIVAVEQQRGQDLVFNRRKDLSGSASTSDGMKFSDVDELAPSVVNGPYIMPRVVGLLVANQAAWQLLSGIPGDLLRREQKTWPDTVTTTWNLRDPWGEQIAVIPPGRAATRGEMKQARDLIKANGETKTADPLGIGIDLEDSTVRTTDESSLQLICKGRRWLFISKGPDRQLGVPPWAVSGLPASRVDSNGDGIPDWDDNVLSFEPGRPGP